MIRSFLCILVMLAVGISSCASGGGNGKSGDLSDIRKENGHTYIRDVEMYPANPAKIDKYTKINVPESWKRMDDKHKNGYKMVGFIAPEPTFSMLLTVEIIPEKFKSFDELLADVDGKDYKKTPTNAENIFEYDKSGADKKALFFGEGEVSGNRAVGLYYYDDLKVTYKITTNVIFVEHFSDPVWKKILVSVLSTYVSFQRI